MIGTETLDDPRAAPEDVLRTLCDIARINRLFGGTRAVVEALEPFFRERSPLKDSLAVESAGERWTLLDVGTGLGDIPRAAAARARRHGIALQLIGIERIPAAARAARETGVGEGAAGIAVLLADGGALPIRPGGVDVVVASQVLHHLPRDVAVRWIAAFDRLARRAVVLADLRRSRLAMAGIWAASFGLGFGGHTRRDAVVSLKRGYTRDELNAMLRDAGVPAVATYQPGFRVVAAWRPRAHR